jgi:four helix bundle protein
MNNHKDLDAWKESMNLVEDVYKLLKTFPQEELYGLISQIRRSAVSIPSNIAEGAARSGKLEFKKFLYISLGSLAELETQLLLAQRFNYFENQSIFNKIIDIRKIICGLINYLKK